MASLKAIFHLCEDATVATGFSKSGGMPKTESDQPAREDDIVVRRLREAGAIKLATSVTTEFGRCPLGYNSHFREPFNPYDENCYLALRQDLWFPQ